MTTLPRVFIYARKSSEEDDRQINSIKDQIGELRAAAIRQNLTIVAEFEESRTAKYPGRPIFNEMIQRVKRGEASTILAWSADRLARNTTDGNTVIECIDRKILSLKFASYPFEPSPQGMLMLQMEFGMARFYVEAMGRRIAMANERRVKEGRWYTRAPLGYIFDHDTKSLKIDPLRAPLIRKAFELYSTGNYTIRQLAREINAAGLTHRKSAKYQELPLSKTRYHELLSQLIYTGVIKYKGMIYQGKHPPIVPVKVFEKCQEVLAGRGWKIKTPFKRYLFSRFFKCGECGCSITHEVQKGHTYLRCSKRRGPCSQPFLREEEAIKQVRGIIKALALDGQTTAWMVQQLKADQKGEVLVTAKEINAAKVELASYDEKEQRLAIAYVGGMSLETYNAILKRLMAEKERWRQKLAYWEKNREGPLEPAIRFIKALHKAETVIGCENPVLQRDFLKDTGSNFVLADRQIRVVFTGCWEVAWKSRFSRNPSPLAHVQSSAPDALVEKCPDLWPMQDRARTLLEQIKSFFKDNPTWE